MDMLHHYLEGHPRTGLCDIGIGGGAFVQVTDCKGWDVNPLAMAWLKQEGRVWNQQPIGAMTFWDSLEHIPHPRELLAKCEKFAFISTPIYESAEACLHSKHCKMPEHLWFFTDKGLTRYMAQSGFTVIAKSHCEESVGREEIGTYAFRRVCNA